MAHALSWTIKQTDNIRIITMSDILSTINNFITFTGLSSAKAAEELNVIPENWTEIINGQELPNTDLMAKMLAYSMSHRQNVSRALSDKVIDINDQVAIEVEQLETITTLLHGNRSPEIQQLGNLISGNVSRLSTLIKSQ